jgi:hypothetical protein
MNQQEIDTFEDAYPAPTQIVIDENTDMSQISSIAFNPDQVTQSTISLRRNMIGMMRFTCVEEFEGWQREAPREIFEITPKAVYDPRTFTIKTIIFVTYNAGIIS